MASVFHSRSTVSTFATTFFHCLLDGEHFLPESWSDDRARCQAAGIPDEMVHRPKSEIALELYRRAVAGGLTFEWLTFDEWYGAKPAFLGALVQARQQYVGEISESRVMWFSRPQITCRRYRRGGRGRFRRTPRVTAGSPKPHAVQWGCAHDRELASQPWERWHLKDTHKGSKVIEVKSKIVWPKGEGGLPMRPHLLLVVRDVLAPEDVKYFLVFGLHEPTVEEGLKVAFSRWRMEGCFQDDKGRVGLDDYESRWHAGLIRHLILSAVPFLSLARMRAQFALDYTELTVRQMRLAAGTMLPCLGQPSDVAAKMMANAVRIIRYHQQRNAQAHSSHNKTRNEILQALGIDMATIRHCCWDTS